MSQEESLEAGGTEEKPNIKAERKPNIEDAIYNQEDRKDDEKWSKDTVEALVERFQDCISNQPDMLRDCLKKHPNISKFISDEGKRGNMKEDRKDDDEWFEDLNEDFKTKSQYLRCKAKSRTQNYFTETKDILSKGSEDNTEMKEKKERVIEEFKRKLQENNFYEDRFDRTADGNQKLCNKDGEFDCQGAYNRDSCQYGHYINPYLREEYRKTLRSWNFNHQIQLGREVWPQLKKAVEKTPPRKKVNLDYFYGLLFTMENIKLVHPACHDERDHNLEVDKEQVFLPV